MNKFKKYYDFLEKNCFETGDFQIEIFTNALI